MWELEFVRVMPREAGKHLSRGLLQEAETLTTGRVPVLFGGFRAKAFEWLLLGLGAASSFDRKLCGKVPRASSTT